MAAEVIDALCIPYFYDVDRWHNDDATSAGPAEGADGAQAKPRFSRRERMAREAISLDGQPYDLARYLSWTRYGTTAEFERYDSYSLTLLAGTYYLSFLRRHGYDVRVANSVNRFGLEELRGKYAPKFVMLSTTLVLENMILKDAVARIRKTWPEAIIVVGGLFLIEIHKTTPAEKFESVLRAYGADAYVVSPRGEHAMLEILKRGTKAELLKGGIPATYVLADRILHAPGDLADPSVPMEQSFIRWNEDIPTEHLYHTVHTRTARSCAFVCAFCNFPINQGPLTLMPVEAFDEELAQLKAMGRVKSLIFTDDTFNVPQKRFKELCRVLAKYDFEWYSFFRPQFADEETVELMAAAHCKAVFLGIESADDQILKNMNKAATVSAFKRGVDQLRKHDIKMHANFIVGFPGETETSARKLVNFLDDTGIEFFTLAPFYYVPSTPIHQRREEFGLEGLFETWKHNTMTSTEAFALTAELTRAPKYAVHAPELAANNFWTQIMFYSNGFTVEEIQHIFRGYNKRIGEDLNAAELRQSQEYADLRAILDRHPMPRPINC